MTYIKIKGFHIYPDRHGKLRCYHRKTRMPIDLSKSPLGTPEFLSEVDRIEKAGKISPPSKPGTLGLLINKYRQSQEFISLKRRTQDDYVRCLNYLKSIEDQPLIWFQRPIIVRIRDKAAIDMGRKWGNYTKTVLSLLFSWACEKGYLNDNPARHVKGIKRPKDAPDANRPWADNERFAVLAEAKASMRVPFALMMFCGLDPQDAMKLSKRELRGNMLNTRRGKTGVPVWVPLPQPVIAIIEAQAANTALTIGVKDDGTPWTKSGFDSAWQPLKKRLRAEGKIADGITLKGLRHTVGTILAEMGYDDRTIADMLGHETLDMARHYSRRADKTKKMKGVVANFNEELLKRNAK